MSDVGAGWHPDPWTPGQYRYWTGSAWTADVFPAGVAAGTAAHPQAPVVSPAAQTSSPWWSAPAAATEAGATPPTAPSSEPPAPPQWGAPALAAPPGAGVHQGPAQAPAAAGGRSRLVLFMALMLLAGLVTGFLAVFGYQQLVNHRSGRDRALNGVLPSATSAPPTAQSPSPSPSPSSRPSTPLSNPPADAATSTLRTLVVRQNDVGPTVTVAAIPKGSQVSGATTLDLCNGTYPSESLRRARLQVVAYDNQGVDNLSTEAVAYENAAATTQAFAELRSVASRCPGAPVPSPVGEPTVTTKFAAAPDASWPRTAGVDRQAYDFTSTDDTGQASHSVAVYLKRGRILLAVYFPHPQGAQSPVAGQSTLPGIVTVFEKRLAAATP